MDEFIYIHIPKLLFISLK